VRGPPVYREGMTDAREWWWCLRHGRVEQDPDVRASERLGPYESAEAAADWQARSERQNKRWDDDDERWREGRGPYRP